MLPSSDKHGGDGEPALQVPGGWRGPGLAGDSSHGGEQEEGRK